MENFHVNMVNEQNNRTKKKLAWNEWQHYEPFEILWVNGNAVMVNK